MNNFLMEMVAARATASGNTEMAEMLSRMMAGADANPVEDVLAKLGPNHPMAGMLAKHLEESKKRSTVIDVEAVKEAEQERTETDEAMSELRAHVQSMFAELTVLRERSDRLAAAVGACCLCWGQNAECRICRGRGGAGFAKPDESLFEEFVLPAVLMLRAQRARTPIKPRGETNGIQ